MTIRSTTSDVNTTTAVMNITIPCKRTTSLCSTAISRSLPSPGSENTDSTTTVPPISFANCIPITFIGAIIALLIAYLKYIVLFLSPLTLAISI